MVIDLYIHKLAIIKTIISNIQKATLRNINKNIKSDIVNIIINIVNIVNIKGDFRFEFLFSIILYIYYILIFLVGSSGGKIFI